jgi:hypothetical protein
MYLGHDKQPWYRRLLGPKEREPAPKCPFCRIHVPNHCKSAEEAARCMFMPKQGITRGAAQPIDTIGLDALDGGKSGILGTTQTMQERHPVVAFMLMRMRRAPGSELDVDVLYPAYLAWHGGGAGTGEPLSAQSFGDSLAYIFRRANIRTRREGDRVFCVGVRLV